MSLLISSLVTSKVIKQFGFMIQLLLNCEKIERSRTMNNNEFSILKGITKLKTCSSFFHARLVAPSKYYVTFSILFPFGESVCISSRSV